MALECELGHNQVNYYSASFTGILFYSLWWGRMINTPTSMWAILGKYRASNCKGSQMYAEHGGVKYLCLLIIKYENVLAGEKKKKKSPQYALQELHCPALHCYRRCLYEKSHVTMVMTITLSRTTALSVTCHSACCHALLVLSKFPFSVRQLHPKAFSALCSRPRQCQTT